MANISVNVNHFFYPHKREGKKKEERQTKYNMKEDLLGYGLR